jgi:hypothetical protein
MPEYNELKDFSKHVGRRKKDRLRTSFRVVWYFENDVENASEAEVVNISSDGACILRNTVINPDDKIILAFDFVNGTKSIKCNVVHVIGKEVSLKFLASEDEKWEFVKAFNGELKNDKSRINVTFKKNTFTRRLE